MRVFKTLYQDRGPFADCVWYVEFVRLTAVPNVAHDLDATWRDGR
jgi:hypothetical protein